MTWFAGALLAIALLSTGCASAVGPDGPLQPLVVGAEQHLTVEWRAEGSDQAAVVWGYVTNQSHFPLTSSTRPRARST
jgi:hypothetical protein